MLFEPNDEYDLLSYNNSIFKSEEYVFNSSFFHNRYENYMDYHYIEQEQYKQAQFNIDDIFPINFEKEEDTNPKNNSIKNHIK